MPTDSGPYIGWVSYPLYPPIVGLTKARHPNTKFGVVRRSIQFRTIGSPRHIPVFCSFYGFPTATHNNSNLNKADAPPGVASSAPTDCRAHIRLISLSPDIARSLRAPLLGIFDDSHHVASLEISPELIHSIASDKEPKVHIGVSSLLSD